MGEPMAMSIVLILGSDVVIAMSHFSNFLLEFTCKSFVSSCAKSLVVTVIAAVSGAMSCSLLVIGLVH